MEVVTRFAPSPTGFLHIGSARTALFNWLYAKSMGGRFLLRIEDTDKVRSTTESVDAIISGLEWLGLEWDGDPVFQLQRQGRHQEVANSMVEKGAAYYCYMSQEEIAERKKKDPHTKIASPWRDSASGLSYGFKDGVSPVIRLRVTQSGETILNDLVQGVVRVSHSELDDMVLVRSDGTPTYMFAVVVDDHDMGVTHVIRGDDHLTNAFRQLQIYEALGWSRPQYGHIPLIHGQDGAKLSKRHGALGVEYYRDAGYLPEAMCSYLMRLGWSYGDQEIIPKDVAARAFNISDVNKAAARFDIQKLDFINAHYIQHSDDETLCSMVVDRWDGDRPELEAFERMKRAIPQLKVRAKTIVDMVDGAQIYIKKHMPIDPKLQQVLDQNKSLLDKLTIALGEIDSSYWNSDNLKNSIGIFATQEEVKESVIMQLLRASVIGTINSPGVYDVLSVLGKQETLLRLRAG